MSNKHKTIIWLLLFILVTALVLFFATYAYFAAREIYEGTFKVDITSKGVDTLRFEKKDAKFTADASNFAINVGHDVSGKAELNVILDTTNPSTKYCYVTSLELPEEAVFDYSVSGVPELVLDISKSSDGINFEKIISQKDITTASGVILIPISSNSTEYKNTINTTKNVTKVDYWQAEITFKWFPDVFQEINDFKTYKAVFKANVVEC